MKKVLFLRMMAVAIIITLLAGCGAANAAPAKTETATEATTAQAETATMAQADTAETATTAQADTSEQAAPAQADTSEAEFPLFQTTVVWLEKGKVLSIEEYTDYYRVTSADGTEEFPLSLPHLEEEELLFTELPVEWQEALSN